MYSTANEVKEKRLINEWREDANDRQFKINMKGKNIKREQM